MGDDLASLAGGERVWAESRRAAGGVSGRVASMLGADARRCEASASGSIGGFFCERGPASDRGHAHIDESARTFWLAVGLALCDLPLSESGTRRWDAVRFEGDAESSSGMGLAARTISHNCVRACLMSLGSRGT